MAKQKNPLLEYQLLIERTDMLLKKKKKELKGCKSCKKQQIYAAGKCKECFLQGRKKKESQNEGKIWLSTDGHLKTYVKRDGRLIVVNLARHRISELMGRPLTRSERVVFKDGNRENCDISNLSLLSDQAISLICPHCASPLQTPEVPSE